MNACQMCCLISALVLLSPIFLFVLFAAPWLAAMGPWVNYYVDVDRIPNDNDTAQLYLQYPMLMFERQQYPRTMCFTQMSTPLWKLVFNLEPTVHHHKSGSTYSYCLSEWNIMKINQTSNEHHVSVSMGNMFSLLVADACWFAWWIPAFVLLRVCWSRDLSFVLPAVVIIVGPFAARVALSVTAMIEFYRYDALTDPPHGAYIRDSPILERFTTRSYAYGFINAWVVIVGNGLIATAVFCLAIYGCVRCCRESWNDVDCCCRECVNNFDEVTQDEGDDHPQENKQ